MDKGTAMSKAKYFRLRKEKVHLVLKDIKKFHNGTIELIEEDHLILNDFKEGQIPIFYSEIFKFEKYVEG